SASSRRPSTSSGTSSPAARTGCPSPSPGSCACSRTRREAPLIGAGLRTCGLCPSVRLRCHLQPSSGRTGTMTTRDETIRDEMELVAGRDHPDPHHFLGAHPSDGDVVVRAFRPGAERVRVLPEGEKPVQAEQKHPSGLFEALLERTSMPVRYRLEGGYPGGPTLALDDPSRFLTALGRLARHL